MPVLRSELKRSPTHGGLLQCCWAVQSGATADQDLCCGEPIHRYFSKCDGEMRTRSFCKMHQAKSEQQGDECDD